MPRDSYFVYRNSKTLGRSSPGLVVRLSGLPHPGDRPLSPFSSNQRRSTFITDQSVCRQQPPPNYNASVKLDAGLLAPDLKSVPAFARAAEEAGYAGLWSFETQHEAFLPLAVAATVTSKIDLGTSIAVAFPRSPMITAHIAWDLAKASDGRFLLGLGSQVKAHNERRFSIKFESPAPKLREYVLALRAIWACWQNGTPLKFKGEFYEFSLMTPFFSPGPIDHPSIPVYIAGVN